MVLPSSDEGGAQGAQRAGTLNKHIRRWGAIWLFFAFFASAWVGQLLTDMAMPGPFLWSEFWKDTFENWQSEWLQLTGQGVFFMALGHVIFKRGTEDIERIEHKVDRIIDYIYGEGGNARDAVHGRPEGSTSARGGSTGRHAEGT